MTAAPGLAVCLQGVDVHDRAYHLVYAVRPVFLGAVGPGDSVGNPEHRLIGWLYVVVWS